MKEVNFTEVIRYDNDSLLDIIENWQKNEAEIVILSFAELITRNYIISDDNKIKLHLFSISIGDQSINDALLDWINDNNFEDYEDFREYILERNPSLNIQEESNNEIVDIGSDSFWTELFNTNIGIDGSEYYIRITILTFLGSLFSAAPIEPIELRLFASLISIASGIIIVFQIIKRLHHIGLSGWLVIPVLLFSYLWSIVTILIVGFSDLPLEYYNWFHFIILFSATLLFPHLALAIINGKKEIIPINSNDNIIIHNNSMNSDSKCNKSKSKSIAQMKLPDVRLPINLETLEIIRSYLNESKSLRFRSRKINNFATFIKGIVKTNHDGKKLLAEYKKQFGSSLISDILNITSKYAHVEDLMEAFITNQVVESYYPYEIKE